MGLPRTIGAVKVCHFAFLFDVEDLYAAHVALGLDEVVRFEVGHDVELRQEEDEHEPADQRQDRHGQRARHYTPGARPVGAVRAAHDHGVYGRNGGWWW